MALAGIIEWLTQLPREWLANIHNLIRAWIARATTALKGADNTDEETPEIIEGETAEIVEDASFCQIYNEKNEQEEQPIVDLDKKTKCSNISLDSDLSDTGKAITKSFDVAEVLKPNPEATPQNDDTVIDENYQSDFDDESDDEKEYQPPKTIKDLRQSVLSEYRGAFFEYDEPVTYKREIKINFENQVVQSVEIEGTFNDWKEPIELQQDLTSVIDNEWGVEIETPKKDFHFRFVVDGARMLSKSYESEETNNGLLNLYES